MVKEEIVEGLRIALSRGETLQKAMMSFFNSGYAKEDIEDAARALQNPSATRIQASQGISPKPVIQPIPQVSSQSPQQPAKIPIENKAPEKASGEIQEQSFNVEAPQAPENNIETTTPNQENTEQSKVIQKVSAYGEKPSRTGTIVIFALVFFLLVLIGALIGIFLFKDEVSAIFNKILA